MITAQTVVKRMAYIGGSDAGAVLGVNPYKTPYKLWLEKTGRIKPPDLSNRDSVIFGNLLEDVIGKEYSRRTGYGIRRCNKTLYLEKYPFIAGNIDRKLDGQPKELLKRKGLEIKTGSFYMAKNGYGDAGTDEIPLYHIAQCQHYMLVTGYGFWDVAALLGGNQFKIYTIERDQQLIADMLQQEIDFWNLVKTDKPPEAISEDDLALMYPKSNDKEVQANDITYANYEALIEVKRKIKALTDERRELEIAVKSAIKDNFKLVYGGKKLATWKTESRRCINSAKLKAEYPEVYEDVLDENASRVLRTY